MHFHLPLLLAIAATALTLPTANQTISNLEKRGQHGWIGTFDDSQCKGPETGPRPELHLDGCTAFTPAIATGYFGIYFGTGVYAFDHLRMFTDAGCKTSVGDPSWKLYKDAYTSNDFACIGVKEFAWQFASVKPKYPESTWFSSDRS